MIINSNRRKYDNYKIGKIIKWSIVIMYLFTFIMLINLINFDKHSYSSLLSIVSKQMTIIIPILVVISCWMYYYTYKKSGLFLIMLIYSSMAFEQIYINIIVGEDLRLRIIASTFLIIPYLLRTVYITLMAIKENKVSAFILRKRKLFIVLTIVLTKIFCDINLYLYSIVSLNDIWRILDFMNTILIIYHFCIIGIMAFKGIKENELIYTVIMLSINFFIIKRAYGSLYIRVGYDFSINEWCDTLMFMGYMVIILGIFLELTLTLNESNRLYSELKIFYSQAEENYNNFICIYNEKANIVYANKKTRDYYGVSEDEKGYELLLKRMDENITKDQEEEFVKNINENNGAWRGNIFLNDGAIIESNFQTIELENGLIYNVVTSKDITDDYKISHELKINEQRLRLITDNIEDLIFTIDIYGVITYVNSAVIKALKCDIKDIIGKPYMNFIGNEDKESIEIVITENNTNITLEHDLINNFNELYIVESVVSTINDFYEEPIGKVIVSRDLQQRKEIEALKRKYKEVREYDQIKNEFFANLSHELRTPINIIYSCMQLMDLKANTEGETFLDCYNKYQKTMKQNCFRMLRLVNNLIDITKIDSGFIKMNFCNYDIVNLVENITMSIIPYVETKKINIIFDTEIEELEIRCDPDKVERVMLNLLSNAVKFTEKEGNIEVKMKASEQWIEISIKDDGIGIPVHMREFIFERFIQTNKSFNRTTEGSGIGLALVKSLVELHNGKVYLNSENKTGTEFLVLLPNKIEENVIYQCVDKNYKPTVDRICIEFSDIYDIN